MSADICAAERALLWQLWRRGWVHLAVLTAGLALITIFVVRLDAGLAPAMLGVSMICWTMHLLHLAEGTVGEGLASGLLLLPVSHRQLSTTTLVGLSGIQVGLFLSGALALSWTVGFSAPLLTAALFIGALSCWALVLIWASAHQPVLRTFALGFPLVVVFLGARIRFGPHAWVDVISCLRLAHWGDQLGLTLLIVMAFLVAPFTVARQRRGEAVGGKRPASSPTSAGSSQGTLRLARAFSRGLWRERTESTWQREQPYRSRSWALGWLAWRENARTLLPMFSLPFVMVGLARLVGLFETADALRFVRAQTGFSLFFAPILVAGVVSRVHEGELEAALPQTVSLRPLAARDIAAHYLRAGAVSLLVIWCMTAVGLAAVWMFTRSAVPGVLPALLVAASAREGFTWWLLAAMLGLLTVGWLQLGWVSTVLLSGRNAMAGMLVLVPHSVAVALLVFQRSSGDRIFGFVVEQGPWAYGLAATIGVGLLLTRAHQRRLFPARTLGKVVLGWTALAAAPLGMQFVMGDMLRSDVGLLVAWVGVSGMIVTPWIACTLAVRWNRHR